MRDNTYLISRCEIVRRLGIGLNNFVELCQKFNIRPACGAESRVPKYLWSEVEKALGIPSSEVHVSQQSFSIPKHVHIPKPKKTNIGGIWFLDTDMDLIREIANKDGLPPHQWVKKIVLAKVHSADGGNHSDVAARVDVSQLNAF